MRKIIVAVALVGVGFVLGAVSGEERALAGWKEHAARAAKAGQGDCQAYKDKIAQLEASLEKAKHVTVSNGYFEASIVLEGVGPLYLQSFATFTVDQANGIAEVVIDASGGEYFLGEESGDTGAVTIAAEGEKD